MKKEITFSSVNTTPSDYDCGDGELSVCMGGMNVDGNIRPIWPGKKIRLKCSPRSTDNVLYIHKAGEYEHFIVYDEETGELWWTERSSGKPKRYAPTVVGGVTIQTVETLSKDFPEDGAMEAKQWYKYTATGTGSLKFTSASEQMNCVRYTLDGTKNPLTGSFTYFSFPFESTLFSVSDGSAIYLYSSVAQTLTAVFTETETPDYSGTHVVSQKKTERCVITQYDTSLEIYQISSIGNTLVVLTAEGMHYYLWVEDDMDYRDLGAHIPELPISFGLNGYVVQSEKFSFDGGSSAYTNWENIEVGSVKGEKDFSSQSGTVSAVTSAILAQVNKFVKHWGIDNGAFLYPFFVRYAYVLYDGSTTMASPPVLMLPSTELNPIVRWTGGSGDEMKKFNFYLYATVCKLDYQVLSYEKLEELRENWKDLVTAINIYVSAPIYNYDQSGEIESLYYDELPPYVKSTACVADIWGYVDRNKDDEDDRSDDVITPVSWVFGAVAKGKCYHWRGIYDTCYSIFKTKRNNWPADDKNGYIVLPRKENDTIYSKIKGTNLFYLLKSYTLDEIECDTDIDEKLEANTQQS